MAEGYPQDSAGPVLGANNKTSFNMYQDQVPIHNVILEQDIIEPLAIVGISMRFPGEAVSESSFWEMMLQKRCAMIDYPPDRMNIDAFYDSDNSKMNKMSTRGAHFIKEDIRSFDAPFFTIPPHEAAMLDPQQRCLLETTYPGIPLERIRGSNTSVHVGCFITDYCTMVWRDVQSIPKHSATGSAGSILANRLSWFFDLRGSSMTVDTACSSGLVAMDLSCNGLWTGQADIGIVAGSNLIFSPELNIALSNMNFLSPDSQCYSFDHRANGYARGEGVAVLILKRLSTALRDGDTIRALIRSSGVNQDGHTAGGVTQPRKASQVQLIHETYLKAGLDMGVTRFVEAHGTGTQLGDPIEARAIGECFQAQRTGDEPLYVGAVKANVGHLEGASGLAAIIKTVQILEKGVIPPNTNFDLLNPQIDADFLKLKFPLEPISWPCQGVRRASVNSFGFGGTNAHAVLDDAHHYLQSRNISGNHRTTVSSLEIKHAHLNGRSSPGILDTSHNIDAKTNAKLLTWSAADESGVYRIANELGEHFAHLMETGQEATFLDDLAFTLNLRRSSLPWKSYLVADSVSTLQDIQGQMSKPMQLPATRRNLGFVFTGQGAQWYAMGRELRIYPVFEKSLSHAQICLATIGCDWVLTEELAADQNSTRINEPEFSQPLTTAIQIALVDLLRDIGVIPSVVVGHSSGEIAAAGYLASELQKRSTNCKHQMVSVGLSQEQVRDQLTKVGHRPRFDAQSMTVSCINSPNNVTISGPEDQVDWLISDLQEQQIFARKLIVGLGYHSPQVSQIASEYLDRLKTLEKDEVKLSKEIVMVSSVSEYWVQNMVLPVNFLGAMQKCCSVAEGSILAKKLDRRHKKDIVTHSWLEIGPHAALQGPIRDILSSLNRSAEVSYVSSLIRKKSANETFLNATGSLICQGFSVDMIRLNGHGRSSSRQPAVLTDLPQYPFNHSVLYWGESAVNKGFRFRQHPHHALLGSQVADWNPQEPKWRLMIRQAELPWISDHKVNGSILYPAAGMLAMALEATKQVTERLDQEVVGYKIQEVEFHRALIFHSADEAAETQISLVPTTNSGSGKDMRYDFRIYQRRNDEEWDEICRGSTHADYGDVPSEVYNDKEAVNMLSSIHGHHAAAARSCTYTMQRAEMYEQLRHIGLDYGSSFQLLDQIHFNTEGEATATIDAVPQDSPSANESLSSTQHHIIHPTILDNFFQLVIVALSRGSFASKQTMVPTRIETLWISSAGVSSLGDVRAHVKAQYHGRRTAQSDITVLGRTDGLLKAKIDGLEVTTLPNAQADLDIQGESDHLCFQMEWKVDLDTMSCEEILRYCERAYEAEIEPIEWFRDSDCLSLAFIATGLKELRTRDIQPIPSLERYASCIQKHLDGHLAKMPQEERIQRLEQLESRSHLDSLCNRMMASRQAKAFIKVGRNLPDVLSGVVDPLHLLFEDEGLMEGFYEEMNETPQCFDVFNQYLDALAHKDAGMNILEIGAGTGSTTKVLLKLLAPVPTSPRYGQYDFTDVSPSFFDKAKSKFGHFSRMEFRVLDIEKDPLMQGYKEGTYDLVLAANVLHATQELQETLANVRKLLRPGGRLVLSEVTNTEAPRYSFAFGILPGWWIATESYRQNGPCITEQKWHQVLIDNGFSGTDIVFRDYKSEECHGWSIMVSTALPAGSDQLPPMLQPIILLNNAASFQQQLSQEIKKELRQQEILGTEIMTVEEAALMDDIQAQHYVLINEVGSSLLRNLDSLGYLAIRTLVSSAASLLWVSDGGGQSPIGPDYGIVQGLSRVCRQENFKVQFVTLALDTQQSSATVNQYAEIVAKVFRISSSRLGEGSYEPEYLQKEGLLYINRLIEYDSLNDHISTMTTLSQRTKRFGEGPPLKLNFKTPSFSDSLQFIEDSNMEKPLAHDEVEVEVRAIGVNFKDVLTILQRINSENIGCECSGVVKRVGQHVLEFQKGDRVALCGADIFRSYARAHVDCITKVPHNMPFTEAAALPVAFCTAYHSLCDVARLQKGETILIHAASGGTGQAAVQIAIYIGAEIFATVGSRSKKQLLMDVYKIPEDHILYSRDTAFAGHVRRMTNGRGVDVVLNSLSGQSLVASWECIAPCGRFVEIGKRDIHSRGSLPMHPFNNNTSFYGVDLAELALIRPGVIKALLGKVMSLAAAGLVTPSFPVQVFPLSETEQAFRLLQSGKSSGKIVIEFSSDSEVPTCLKTKPACRLLQNATYVVSGGLGGLGLSIARWLVDRGAKNLLLLSRSGPEGNEKAQAVLAQLGAEGVRIQAPKCDVAEAHSLEEVLLACEKIMPPIKGCFQAAMVLRDSTFESMSYQDWKESLNPKVLGSWNLHAMLPDDMDFFVLLSSATGIFGNAGQSNYAAGNTYQDSLAQYRNSLQLPATALDLGVILSEGIVADSPHLMDYAMRVGLMVPITVEQLFAVLDYYCDPKQRTFTAAQSQPIVGIDIPSRICAKGKEIPYYLRQPLFRNMYQIASTWKSSINNSTQTVQYQSLFESTESLQEAGLLVSEGLRKKMSKVLGIPEENIELTSKMESYGVDSLAGVELRNWLAREISADVTIFEIMGPATLLGIGKAIAAKSSFRQSRWSSE
ncbi:reducing type I polyketide synthase [Mollisia scopiformis]|uniref:Reducing type I polyketide synthase n=1 Tax=Mollisia scopiformis TaxID=149040 RepID=A0A194WZ69_MOLSC|nr:reducing type I polyketide synthase [Mollisia scopiformis]KUJ13246.1 reducing type I polyketide synthase [Mollisia scopiformis]